MTQPYDSTADTQAHIDRIWALLTDVRINLIERSRSHDASKLIEPEKSAFDRATPALAAATYGTPDYEAAKAQLGDALTHHYAHNAHHPEHHTPITSPAIDQMRADLEVLQRLTDTGKRPDSAELAVIHRAHAQLQHDLLIAQSRINRMSLLDILEMLADWKAAGERTANGDLAASLAFNRGRHAIGEQLAQILDTTARELGWIV